MPDLNYHATFERAIRNERPTVHVCPTCAARYPSAAHLDMHTQYVTYLYSIGDRRPGVHP